LNTKKKSKHKYNTDSSYSMDHGRRNKKEKMEEKEENEREI